MDDSGQQSPQIEDSGESNTKEMSQQEESGENTTQEDAIQEINTQVDSGEENIQQDSIQAVTESSPSAENEAPKSEDAAASEHSQVETQPKEDTIQAEKEIEDNATEQLMQESDILDDPDCVVPSESSEKNVSLPVDEIQDMESASVEEQRINTAKAKPKSGTFSLGVPGLTFSSQNLKVANDGTKMVQIHQSQITPTQLQALQSNPNIKVVFRHIPTGKSFTKPPKNLFSCLSKQQGTKRKISSDHGGDDSIYNFDEDFDKDYTDNKPRGSISKYARYTPNIGMKKRGPGRPRLIPDPHAITTGLGNKQKPPAIPAQILLTDALTKLNNPNAPHMVKIHVKQVTHDILANMELNPNYNLVLTAKHDLPPEHSLEELVKEWEEKEVEHSELKDPEFKIQEETPINEMMMEEGPILSKPNSDVDENEEDERLLAEQQRLREEQKEREEAEILAAAMQERKSRSGRIRKPSRYSLDIARLTKRRNVTDDTSPDEDYVASPPKPVIPKITKPEIITPGTPGTPGKKRGRGRPRKIRPEDTVVTTPPTTSSMDDTETNAIETEPIMASPEHKKTEPMVIMSPSDKELAETIRLKDTPEQTTQDGGESSKTEEIKETIIAEPKDQTEETSEKNDEKENAKIDEPEKMDVSLTEAKTSDEEKTQEILSEENMETIQTENDETKETPPETKSEEENIGDVDSEKTSDEKAEEKTETIKEETETTKEDTETTKEEIETTKEEIETTKEDTETTKEEIETTKEDNETTKEEIETMKEKDENDVANTEKTENDVSVGRKISSDGETPSDILARKLDIAQEDPEKEEQSSDTKESEQKPQLKDFVEEEGDVDNKYRLRKLLQQCTIDEIRSVAIPRALDAISIGDFFLHKAGQMSTEKVKFASLYKQLEVLHSAIEKESVRYNTLLRRANKVGGDRRMDKVILMPIYNKKAAESIHIIGSSIDAHIGGINQKSTAQMIAANSFRMNCKMEAPVHRLKLPDLAEKNQRNKRRQFQHKYSRHPEPDSTTPDQPNQRSFGRLPGNLHTNSWKKSSYQVRKPSYLLGSSTGTAHSTLQEQARMQLVGRYQSQLVMSKDPAPVADSSATALATENVTLASQSSEITSVANVDLNPDLITQQQVGDSQAAQVVTEDGSAVIAAEEGKQLVSIGDGQYVELPEGYTLIQTDDGYIIGQPGATFVQGEDGNVYMTSTEEGAEAATQVLTTTAPIGETPAADALLDELGQT